MRAALVLATLALVPFVSAVPPEGTETSPELVDASGDVSYSFAYTGPPHPYIDLLASWVDYVPSNDTFVAVLKTEDASQLRSLPNDQYVSCGLDTGVFVDTAPNGRLWFAFRFEPATPRRPDPLFVTNVQYVETEGGEGAPVKHGFSLDVTAPGYARFWVDRATVQLLGTALGDFRAQCQDSGRPAGLTSTYDNFDTGRGTATFGLDAKPPVPAEPATEETTGETVAGPTTGDGTPLGIVVAATAITVAAVWRRR